MAQKAECSLSSASLPFRQSALMQSTTCATAHGHLLGISCSTPLRDGCSISFICVFTLLSPLPFLHIVYHLGFFLVILSILRTCALRGVCICWVCIWRVYPTLPWKVASLPYVLDTRFMARTCSVQDYSYLP